MNLLEETILDLRGVLEEETSLKEKGIFIKHFLKGRVGVQFVAAPSHFEAMYRLMRLLESEGVTPSTDKRKEEPFQELLIFMEPESRLERRLVAKYLADKNHCRRTFVCL